MHLQLKLIDGVELEFEVTTNPCVIGRSPRCNVVIPYEGVSRQHCQIEYDNGDFYVTDLGSTNGVMIDGIKIEPHTRTAYSTFLTLSFGPVVSVQITDDISVLKKSLKTKDNFPEGQTSKMAMPDKDQVSIKSKKKQIKTKDSKPSLVLALKLIAVLFLLVLGWWLLQNKNGGEENVSWDGPIKSSGKLNSNDFL